MAGLAIDVEADDGFRAEFLLLRDQQRGLQLILDGLLVEPERARDALALVERQAFPESGWSKRVGHSLIF